MRKRLAILSICVALVSTVSAQQGDNQAIFQVSKELLAGEGLDTIKQSDPTRRVFQKKVYDGKDLAIYMVAIGTGITNEFESFPMEEFIYWMNGKAVVEPEDEDPFEVYAGDYFIQAKGFRGKWSFVDSGGLHLELALIAKDRPDSTFKSPMSHAIVLDRNSLSGVSPLTQDTEEVYEGVELTVNMVHAKKRTFDGGAQERMIHVVNGIVTLTDEANNLTRAFYPGDFFVIPEGFKGTWNSKSQQGLRTLEVFKTKTL